MSDSKCFFTGEKADVVKMDIDAWAIQSKLCEEYFITGQAFQAFQGTFSQREGLLCLKESINLNNSGLTAIWRLDKNDNPKHNYKNAVFRTISDFSKESINHSEKEVKLLELLAKKANYLNNPFELLQTTIRERIALGIFSDEEYYTWVEAIRANGWIDFDETTKIYLKSKTMGFSVESRAIDFLNTKKIIKLTTDGWKFIHKESQLSKTKKVFIAMAFTDEKGTKLPADTRDAIKDTINKLDHDPIIIDEVEHNDGVMDKIIVHIHESRFVVADLTYNKSGVYYEAGYAKAHGLSVVFTVKEDHLKYCHFDVKHLNLIVWKDIEDLKTKLENRIKATILTPQTS